MLPRLITITISDCGKIPTARGSRQVVRRQPSKLISAGSNPVSRSLSVISRLWLVISYCHQAAGHCLLYERAHGAVVSAGDS
jgi:hypothetical protein